MNESTTDVLAVPIPTGQDVLTEVLRDGARKMLARAVEAEVAAWVADHAHLKDEIADRGRNAERGRRSER